MRARARIHLEEVFIGLLQESASITFLRTASYLVCVLIYIYRRALQMTHEGFLVGADATTTYRDRSLALPSVYFDGKFASI